MSDDFSLLTLIKNPAVISALLTGVTAIVVRLLQPTPNILWGTSHGFTFLIPRTPPPQPTQGVVQQQLQPADLPKNLVIHAKTIFLRNHGRAAAEGVEIILNFKPEHFSVWPQMNYTTIVNPEDRFIIKLENLGKSEFIAVEMIHSISDMPRVLRIRTARGECREVPMAPMRVMPRWFNISVIVLLILGLFQAFKWIFLLLGYPHS